MPTSAAGTSSNRRLRAAARPRATGFTLLEVLVVVTIIGILVAMATVSFNVLGGDHEMDQEAERLVAVLGEARDDAMLHGRDLGLRVDTRGYDWLKYDSRTDRWVPIDDDIVLRARTLPEGVQLALLRVPGIYAEGRLPLDRIKHGTPVLTPDDDVFTNHIQADDLARAAVAALFHARPNRAYNVTDDSEMKMGGWFDTVADAFHLPRPPRVTWEEAEQRIAPMLLSFMSESRRLVNDRMKRELRVRLVYPTPHVLLSAVAPRELKKQLPLAL